jgi:hypothetical protein
MYLTHISNIRLNKIITGWHDVYFEVKDKDENQVSKCGLPYNAYMGECMINANACHEYSFSSTQQSPFVLVRDGDAVWSGKNGDVCVSCDQYVLTNVTDTVEIDSSGTLQTCSTDTCEFNAGVLVDIEVHAGDFFSGSCK